MLLRDDAADRGRLKVLRSAATPCEDWSDPFPAFAPQAVAVPKYLPKLGAALNPLFRSTVRGTYKLAQQSREMFAEAQEQVSDIVAEVKAESEAEAKEAVTKDRHAA